MSAMNANALRIALSALGIFALGVMTGRESGRRIGAKLAIEGKAYALTNVVTNVTVRFEAEP